PVARSVHRVFNSRALGAVKLRTGGERAEASSLRSEVRDPAAASGRLTRWNSWTDGQSPDGKTHARVDSPPAAVGDRGCTPRVRDRTRPGLTREGAAMAFSEAEHHAMRRAI